MNNNEKPSLKSKGMSVAIVICFVVVVSVVGAVVYNSYHRRATGSQLAKNNTVTEETRTTNTNDIVLPQAEEDTSAENGSETGTNESAETHRQRQQHRQNKFISMKNRYTCMAGKWEV